MIIGRSMSVTTNAACAQPLGRIQAGKSAAHNDNFPYARPPGH
ncbi:MAG: hypothetical protein R2860_14200 [Desulfobacterales bacterium]